MLNLKVLRSTLAEAHLTSNNRAYDFIGNEPPEFFFQRAKEYLEDVTNFHDANPKVRDSKIVHAIRHLNIYRALINGPTKAKTKNKRRNNNTAKNNKKAKVS